MKLVEHIEHIIGLVDNNATPATIKGAVIAMREEAAGYDAAIEKALKVTEENTRLQKQVDQFVSAAKQQRPTIGGIPPFTSIT